MELSELEKHWNAHGEIDPMWAILSLADKRGNAWNADEFFALGVQQIDGLMATIDRLRITRPTGPALDFGCGVGRLTQALLQYVDKCFGIDIAASMIERAQELNRHGERAIYLVNSRNDLQMFPDNHFGLIYSSIVLQHMEPRYSLGYIREFVRAIRPGGLGVFQLPGGPRPVEDLQKQFPEHVAFGPLPPEGFHAWLRSDAPPATLTPGKRFTLSVRVRNVSQCRWPQFGLPDTRFGIRLGTRWFDELGRDMDRIDERLYPEKSLDVGDEAVINLAIHAPEQPGRYLLEVDMAQEYVGWFRDKGSRSLTFGVEVQPLEEQTPEQGEPTPQAASQTAFEPRIEMYHVRKNEVEEAITRAGGRVLHVQEVFSRPVDLDFEYYFTK